jgi:oxygen-independent coproporphyrinogen-3 oxidase
MNSVYIHIPFCSTKCTYCAFNTYIKLEYLIEPFIDALCREIEIVEASQPNLVVHTIFFGGGTPSLLTTSQFRRILAALQRCFDVLSEVELTLEANPNDLSQLYLAELHALGFNRISIGMQSAIDHELKLFHRRHDAETVIHAVTAARAAGFENVNLDLIYGIPRQTLLNWETSLRRAIDLAPEHIALYALGLEDGTPLKSLVDSGHIPSPDDDLSADMYDLATEILGNAGYQQYEISNWAKPGFQCRHNLQYWWNLPYIGLGPGAHGYAGGMRYANLLLPPEYIRVMQNTDLRYGFPRTPATAEAVLVDRDDEIAETLIMGLRLTQEGIRRVDFADRFGVDLLEIHGKTLERFIHHGLLHVDNQVVRLTQQGRFLSNVIFRELV